MKIRATNKVLSIARIKAVQDPTPLMDKMPGEWYASVVSMGMPGKLAIHFLHYPTLISLIIPEKSLNKAVSHIPDHLASLLNRRGFNELLSEYQIDTDIEIFATDNDLAVFEQTGLSPYGGPPLHIHPFQDEWFYVVEGEYLFQVGDDKYEMKPGDTIFLPRNVKHAFIQLTEKGKMIVSYLPAGKMEAFFEVTDQWTAPPSKEEIVKVFADHDMLVVGEPLRAH